MTQFDPDYSENKMKKHDRMTKILLGGCFTVFVCFACFVGLGIAGYAYYEQSTLDVETAVPTLDRAVIATERAEIAQVSDPTATPALPEVTATEVDEVVVVEETAVPTPIPQLTDIGAPASIDQSPIPVRAINDLNILLGADFPANDYFEASNRLGNYNLEFRTVPGDKYTIGDVQQFFNGDDRIEAELVEITEHAYFWVETSLNIDKADISNAAITFEEEYYESTIEIFGNYWTPGIDQDHHFTVLHLEEGTSGELGRFNSTDEFPRELYSNSNEQELVYLSMEELEVGEELYFGTLVHEMQHLIQWNMDPSETVWVNEGLSQLSELMVGLHTSTVSDYLLAPETPLNRWNYDEPDLYAHYSASYLFLAYFWEQLGDTAVQDLAAHPANGMAGVNQVLSEYMPDVSLTQFIGNWAAANYLDDIFAGLDYYYDTLDFKKPTFIDVVDSSFYETETAVEQFSVHYYDMLDLRGPVQIKFAGNTVQKLIDSTPNSGEQMWFAPPIDELNAQLTASFDLSTVSSATLEYAIWYDLEEDYDFAYVSISTDNGATWDILLTEESSAGDYGPAYNGTSDSKTGWVDQSISLNEYTGNTVLIRFEVLTDSDITNRGVAIDDISIPELNNYKSTVEDGTEGWQAQGFVPIGTQLPQQWSVQLIQDGPEPTVETLPLDTYNQAVLDVEIGKGGAVLVIVPTTPFTRESANYWLQVESVGLEQ